MRVNLLSEWKLLTTIIVKLEKQNNLENSSNYITQNQLFAGDEKALMCVSVTKKKCGLPFA